jgi:hypothetical protein
MPRPCTKKEAMNAIYQFPDRVRGLGLAAVSAFLFCGGTIKALEPSDASVSAGGASPL